jgi:hypothetical protein
MIKSRLCLQHQADRVAAAFGSPFAVTDVPGWPTRGDNIIMRANLAIIILGATVFMANGADARTVSRGHGRAETLQQQPSGGLYESLSQGHQSYPNPDRELYVNRSCCSWSSRKAKSRRRPIAH